MAILTTNGVVNSINDRYSSTFVNTNFLQDSADGKQVKPVGTRITIVDGATSNLFMVVSSVTVSDIVYYFIRAITNNEWFVLSHISKDAYSGMQEFTADIVVPLFTETIGSDVVYNFEYDNARVGMIFNG